LAFLHRAAAQTVVDTDPLDHKDSVLNLHVALSDRVEPAFVGIDSARLQRAPEGAG
jgi:hypothetical protein